VSVVTIHLALAVVCFTPDTHQVCHPALVGADTPTGEFSMVQRLTADPGYGGDVLQFHETPKSVYAIHRVWTLRPEEKRLQRLASPEPRHRRGVTGGCVNVSAETYEALVGCCVNQKVVIK
jgi:hypothetical protein